MAAYPIRYSRGLQADDAVYVRCDLATGAHKIQGGPVALHALHERLGRLCKHLVSSRVAVGELAASDFMAVSGVPEYISASNFASWA